ncbi:MAG: ATP-binding protein [Oligoflexia bacterium]|nr:ATP-binding protein [Oligoflexia bacterium]
MTQPLSLDRIRTLYDAFGQAAFPAWDDWLAKMRQTLVWVAEAGEDQLRSRGFQKRLWSLKDVASAGASENLSVEGVLQDPAVLDLLVTLRDGTWSPEPSRRADELQAHFETTLARVRTQVSGRTPVARLIRIFSFLRPGDLHCGYSWDAHMKIRSLLVGNRRIKQVEANVHARARLREALGPEADLDEHARRSVFCWWLYEHADAIAEGEIPGPVNGGDTTVRPVPETLTLWGPDRQYRWPEVFKGGVSTLRMPLRECLDRRSFEDLQGAVFDELGPGFATPLYLRRLLRLLRWLGMLDELDGRYVTTSAGEQLLQGDPPDPLIEALLVRIVGFAWLLRYIAQGPRDATELSTAAARFVAGQGGKQLWSRLTSWAMHVGLVERQVDSRWHVTALGRDWVARLPVEIVVPDHVSADPVETGTGPMGPATAPHPDFAALWAAFQGDPDLKRFVFSRDQLRSLHTAWTFHPAKRFAILSGLSGSGKTRLLILYAQLVCKTMGLDLEDHLAVVPVRPDWRDPTGLLGYFNALHAEPTFQVEPALQLVLRASRHPKLPFFLVLDEMNLARVERYFAPFLSTMETGRALQLHAEQEPVNGVPPSVPWPSNLRIGGTVNMDETTHPFSDKVLDRAFTLEFWEVDLERFMQRRPDRTAADAPVEDTLLELQGMLRPIRRHVGYRTAGEVLAWVAAARTADPDAAESTLIDQAIFSKVLPRLRGTESSALTDALDKLHAACKARDLSRCQDKLAAMRTRLLDTGVTSFWS